MAWTTPVTWTNSAAVGASDLNEQIRDNMNFLFSPTFDMIVTNYTGGAIITASASTAVPITAGLSSEITTYGGAIQCYFQAHFSGATFSELICSYNGTAVSGAGSSALVSGKEEVLSYNVWITGLASGTHVIMPMWRQPAGNTMRIEASAYPIVWWVREG